MMKEVDPQIYRIPDEKGKITRFQKSTKGFSENGRFLANLKNHELTTKEVKSCFVEIDDQKINDERG
jgi:hypothetical protein